MSIGRRMMKMSRFHILLLSFLLALLVFVYKRKDQFLKSEPSVDGASRIANYYARTGRTKRVFRKQRPPTLSPIETPPPIEYVATTPQRPIVTHTAIPLKIDIPTIAPTTPPIVAPTTETLQVVKHAVVNEPGEEAPPPIMNHPAAPQASNVTDPNAMPRDCIRVDKPSSKLEWTVKPKDCTAKDRIIMLIKSSIYKNHLRNYIRETWASESFPLSKNGETFHVKRVFLIGSEPNFDVIPAIDREMNKYKDVMQCSFADTPESITRKVLLGMEFVKNHCFFVKLVIVTDDESMFSPWNLFTLLGEHMGKLDFFGGFTEGRQKPVRDQNNQYYVPEDQYKCNEYPMHSVASAYFMSRETMVRLYYTGLPYQMFKYDHILFSGLVDELGIQSSWFSIAHYIQCSQVLSSTAKISVKALVLCNGLMDPKDQQLVWLRYCNAPVVRNDLIQFSSAFCEPFLKT